MPTPANSINEATTGIVGFTGTSFTATPVTQFDVLIGGATSSAIVNVTNGTTGQFLGANTGAAPTWQTPASGVTSVVTTNATPQFSLAAGVETINFALTNLVLGSSLPALSGATATVGMGSGVLAALTSGSANTVIGYLAGQKITSGASNTIVGQQAFINATTSLNNTVVGNASLSAVTTGAGSNLALGYEILTGLVTGSGNIALGGSAGNSYTGAESNNILICNSGVAAESNVIRIGTQGSGASQQNECFIAGIVGVTTTNSQAVTINSSTGQLGVTALPSFAPNATINQFDDFIGASGDLAQTITSAMSWTTATAITSPWVVTNAIDNGHPGLLSSGSVTTSNPDSYLFAGETAAAGLTLPIILGGGVITVNWVIKIVTLSNSTNRYTLRLGLGDTKGADQANGIYFIYSDNINSSNYTLGTASGSTRTATNSGFAANAGYVNLSISANAAASTITYFVNGVSKGTVATNIPTTALTPFVDVVWSVGTVAAGTILVDLFYMTQTLTTPR
jgi:hypothetical protein